MESGSFNLPFEYITKENTNICFRGCFNHVHFHPLSLSLSVAPYFRLVPDLMNRINISRSVALECEAMAIPPPEYIWFRYDPDTDTMVRLMEDDRVYIIGNGTLFFESTIRTDTGSYICQASNTHGMIESEPVMVSVYGE